MPELPEIETIRRILKPQLVGKMIASVEVNNAQVIAYPDEQSFVGKLTGLTFADIDRRGKYLILIMESGDRMVVHLRMTGQLLVTPPDFEMEKHTHLVLNLSDGNEVRYTDVRRFGRFWLLDKGQEDAITGMSKLGIEPLDPKLTGAWLRGRIGKRKKTIKEILHDQSVIAGIGNIYSDEILSSAGIYPGEKCVNLEDQDWDKLAAAIPEIIKWGIAEDHMTPDEYLHGKGKEYRNMPDLRVYGRAGQPCKKCGTVIEKVVIGGRSSCYCPKCQPVNG